LPEGFEPTAVNANAPERERRRELKGRLEAEREAEKARADAEKARGDELARQLEEAKNPKGPSNDEGRTANAQSKPLDRLGSNPLIREARQEKAGHANAYQTANRLLDLLDTKPEVVIAEIKARDNVDLSDRPPEEIRYILNRAREGALLKHSESAGHLAALEREAERNLGAMAQSWTAYTHNLIPELKDPKSEAAVEHGKTFTAYPWLNEDPRGSYVAACITEGHRVLAVRAKRAQAGAAAPAGTATAAPARPVARPAVAPIPGQAASLPDAAAPAGGASALFQKFVKTGKAEDREAWMAAVMAEAARAA
jgi:hypothetical protein